MPELPEVETTLRGIKPHAVGKVIQGIKIREYSLRYRIPSHLKRTLKDTKIEGITRRAKYLIFKTSSGSFILHLGMSGSLRIANPEMKPSKHDHVDIELDNKKIIRFRDPRRFGLLLWVGDNPLEHRLLRNLGPEPLTKAFNGLYLHKKSRNRKISVKNFLMNSHIVAGIGNIYASEALFKAGVRPGLQSKRCSLRQYESLSLGIKKILKSAITNGGTSLRDFTNESGNPGYFKNKLHVYQRHGMPCYVCGETIKKKILGQRSSFYCPSCQSR